MRPERRANWLRVRGRGTDDALAPLALCRTPTKQGRASPGACADRHQRSAQRRGESLSPAHQLAVRGVRARWSCATAASRAHHSLAPPSLYAHTHPPTGRRQGQGRGRPHAPHGPRRSGGCVEIGVRLLGMQARVKKRRRRRAVAERRSPQTNTQTTGPAADVAAGAGDRPRQRGVCALCARHQGGASLVPTRVVRARRRRPCSRLLPHINLRPNTNTPPHTHTHPPLTSRT